MNLMNLGTHTSKLSRVAMLGGATIGFLFGGWNELLTALIVLQGLDMLLGVMTAGKRRQVSSRMFLAGIYRKLGIWIGLILAHTVDAVVFNGQPVALTGLTFSFLAYEGLSIIENLVLLGVPIPDWLSRLLIQVRDANDEHMNNMVDGVDSEGIYQVVVRTKYGEERVLHNDEDTKEFYDKLYDNQEGNCPPGNDSVIGDDDYEDEYRDE